MEDLRGKYVTFYCGKYIYAGTLVDWNEDFVQLTDASIVYETGSFTQPEWNLVEPLPHDWRLNWDAVESFGVYKNAKA